MSKRDKHPRSASQHTRDPKQKRRRRLMIWSSIGAAVLILGGVSYATLSRTGDAGWNSWRAKHGLSQTKPNEASRFTALLIGTDTRPGESGGNTDVMMVLSIDYKNKRIALLSIPRDTMVKLPDGTTGKINALYDIGGIEAAGQVVQTLIDFDIPNYAITHFGGLVNIIDTIGGVWVNVPESMHFNTGDKIYGTIDLNPGYQKLSGQQALGFVRFREDPLGDIGRTERQQAFLKALEKSLVQPSNILKLPQLVTEFSGTIDTNLSKGQELAFATNAGRLKGFHVITMTLPGAYYTYNGLSYWLVNAKEAQWMAHRLFAFGIPVAKTQTIQTVDAVNNWTPPTAGSKTASSGNG